MEVVLHTKDLEPITVINLNADLYKTLNKEGVILVDIEGVPDSKFFIFRRWVDFRVPGLDIAPMYIASNEVLALQLMPVLLPGQRSKFA